MACRKSKVNTFIELYEQITKRVIGWKEKFISKVRREILIKTIAQAIPTYTMSLFKLPKALCDSINSAIARYWWVQTKDERKIHWINWRKLCTTKKNGGMGFRDIQAFNLAMLAKQAWRLIHHTHSLFYRVYKVRYFPNCSFMEAEIKHSPSFVWWRLVVARKVIMEGSRWRVGNEMQIMADSRNWLSHKPVFKREKWPNLPVGDLIDDRA